MTSNPLLTPEEQAALASILTYAKNEHGKSQGGSFSPGGWAGYTLAKLLERSRLPFVRSEAPWVVAADKLLERIGHVSGIESERRALIAAMRAATASTPPRVAKNLSELRVCDLADDSIEKTIYDGEGIGPPR